MTDELRKQIEKEAEEFTRSKLIHLHYRDELPVSSIEIYVEESYIAGATKYAEQVEMLEAALEKDYFIFGSDYAANALYMLKKMRGGK